MRPFCESPRFTHDKQGALVKTQEDSSFFDDKVTRLKWMHLAIFILQFIGTINFTKELNVNMQIIKKFFYFITVPMYFYVIVDCYETLHLAYLNVVEEPANASEVKLLYPFCMQTKFHGDSIHWIRLEIMGFYANILVLIFYLVGSRLDKDAAARRCG